jgi:hypothetical protein
VPVWSPFTDCESINPPIAPRRGLSLANPVAQPDETARPRAGAVCRLPASGAPLHRSSVTRRARRQVFELPEVRAGRRAGARLSNDHGGGRGGGGVRAGQVGAERVGGGALPAPGPTPTGRADRGRDDRPVRDPLPAGTVASVPTPAAAALNGFADEAHAGALRVAGVDGTGLRVGGKLRGPHRPHREVCAVLRPGPARGRRHRRPRCARSLHRCRRPRRLEGSRHLTTATGHSARTRAGRGNTSTSPGLGRGLTIIHAGGVKDRAQSSGSTRTTNFDVG